jgi:hypothetical protein
VMALDANADDTAQAVAAFTKAKGLTMPIVLDPDGRIADLFGIDKTTRPWSSTAKACFAIAANSFSGGALAAADALKAVLAGREVAVETTPHNG